MADSIKITTQELKNTASEVRSINTDLQTQLEDINQKMNNLESTWESDGARDIRAAMNALNPRFEQYWSVVNSYATFLDNTATQYETAEQQVVTAASQFK